jgi:hypothetical protein
MGYWGWRPLMLCWFISVWIVSCTGTRESASPPPPTELPLVTPIIQTAQRPTPTVDPALPVVVTLLHTPTTTTIPADPAAPSARHTPTPYALLLPTPTCYETAEGGILCLGVVKNTQPQPVGRVITRVELFGVDGLPLDVRAATVEQRLLPPGVAAPYRALFPAPGDGRSRAGDFGAALVSLLRAESAVVDERLIRLEIDEDEGGLVDEMYVISAQVRNPWAENVDDVRLVATVYDERERVAGYRVVEVETLAAEGAMQFEIAIRPEITGGLLRHTLHAEGRRQPG